MFLRGFNSSINVEKVIVEVSGWISWAKLLLIHLQGLEKMNQKASELVIEKRGVERRKSHRRRCISMSGSGLPGTRDG